MTEIASAVGVLDTGDGEYTDRQAVLDVTGYLLFITVFLVVGGCVL